MEPLARRLLSSASRCSHSTVFRTSLPVYRSGPSCSVRHHSSSPPKPKPFPRRYAVLTAFALSGTITASLFATPPTHSEILSEDDGHIRLSDVHKHGRGAERIWVIRGTHVYDITEWIPNHPGGEVILKAAGGSIDTYWKIFAFHQKQDVYDVLEQYFIGKVDPRDLVNGEVPTEQVDDPFVGDPIRDARLQLHTDRPCNAETPSTDLATNITPNCTFYVRNHFWVPDDDVHSHRLTVELPDGEEKEYTLEDLKARFEEVKVTATLQCSGNRRKHMTEIRATNGLQWNIGAIGTAEWAGVRLRDVLADAGFPVNDVPDDTKHAHFLGSEAYGASIPIDKALDRKGDVILAYSMNGKALPPDHGYPLRVLVPGNVAARSVKWVKRIALSDEESPSQWQRKDYKCFGPNEGSNPNWDGAKSIQEMPVQSAITSIHELSPQTPDDLTLARRYNLQNEDSILVEGYAFSGGGREIVRVDVSADGGRTWNQAEILPFVKHGSKAWTWTQWRFAIPKRLAGKHFVVKAVDEAYNTQPEAYEPQYNYRGNLTSAWHRVKFGEKSVS